jgi:hypothetical protein
MADVTAALVTFNEIAIRQRRQQDVGRERSHGGRDGKDRDRLPLETGTSRGTLWSFGTGQPWELSR